MNMISNYIVAFFVMFETTKWSNLNSHA